MRQSGMPRKKPKTYYARISFRAPPNVLAALEELTKCFVAEHRRPTQSDAIRAAILGALEEVQSRGKRS